MAKREIKNPAAGLFNAGEASPTPQQKTPAPAAISQLEPIQSAPAVVSLEQREPRSQRKQILLQPSIHKRAEAKCRRLNVSMNEAINQLLKNWLDSDNN